MDPKPAEPSSPLPVRGFRPSILPRAIAFVAAGAAAAFALSTGTSSLEVDHDVADLDGARRIYESSRPVRLLRDYVRIDTSNPPGLEAAGAGFLAGLIREAGVPAEIVCPAEGRCSVVARLEGTEPAGGLLLVHHIDVVPAEEADGWKEPPFSGNLRNTEIYGRGTVDDKSMGIAFLEGFLEVARNGRPRRTLVFLADADEENLEQRYGVKWLLANRPELFRGVDYALNEGGVAETPSGRLQYVGLEVGHPSISKLEVEAPDRAVLEGLERRAAAETFPFRLTPAVRDFLHRISYVRRATWREGVDRLDDSLTDPEFLRIFPVGYLALLRPSLTLRRIRSEGATFRADLITLTPPGIDPAPTNERARRLAREAGLTIVSEVIQPESPVSGWPTPLSRMLADEIHRSLPTVPVGPYLVSFTSTTSKYLRLAGITTYGISPFRLTFSQASSIHGVDERIHVQWFVDGVDLMVRLVTRFAELPVEPGESRSEIE